MYIKKLVYQKYHFLGMMIEYSILEGKEQLLELENRLD